MELVSYLAEVTARGLGLAAAVLLGVWVLRVKTAAGRHAALTVATCGMLALAGLTAALPAIPVRVMRAERAAAVVPVAAAEVWADAAVPMAPVTVQPLAKLPQKRAWLADLSRPMMAAAVYFGVMLMLLVRLGYGYLFTRRLVRASCVCEPEEGRRKRLPHYESTWIAVPITVGWLRPKVILPVVWKEWDAAKLAAALAHERMHVARADWAIAAVAAVNRCVFWFNPLAWWMERKLAFLAEQACDDAALLESGARETYAEALLDMAAAVRTGRGRMVWEAMAMARTAEVKKRIERILDETREIPRGVTRGRWATLVACSLPLLVVMAAARLAPAQAPVAMPPAPGAPVEIAQAAPAAVAPPVAPPKQAAAIPAQASEERRFVVLYLDMMGMSTYDQLLARNAAWRFVSSQMTATDSVAIAVNTGSMKVLQDFTEDRDRLSQVFRDLPADTGPAAGAGVIRDVQHLTALETAVRMLGPIAGKKALMYFNSGRNRHGFAGSPQMKATIDAAVQSGVAIYPVDVSAQAEGALVETEVGELVVRASHEAPYPYRLLMAVEPVQKVEPAYPAEALDAAFEGDVRFEVIIGTDGHVRDVKGLREPSCGGKPCGAEAMVAAAREAVSHYVYAPVKAPNGEPAEIDTVVGVPFRLRSVVTGSATGDTAAEIRVMTQNYRAQSLRAAADSGGDHPASVLSKVDPEYPYAQRAQGHQGTVTVEVTVGVDGAPKGARVTQSDPAFDDSVTTAVRQWRFAPARKGGQAVESTVTLPVSFRLE